MAGEQASPGAGPPSAGPPSAGSPIARGTFIAESDILIVGAGIVGLAHAAAAVSRGLSVTVIDRDSHAVGASVRNFGHCCITAQSGELLELALVAREKWLRFSARAGFFSVDSGALAVARTDTELAVLEELAASRDAGQVALLTHDQVRDRLGPAADVAIVGGALLCDDLRVDPREAVGRLAAWLADQPGVRFLWQTSYLRGRDGIARTTRGAISADHTIICVGHDLDYLFPDLAADHAVRRCALQMARVEAPPGLSLGPAVLTGTSLLRYSAFTETSAAGVLRAELARDAADLIDIDANVMFTQRPDGTLIVGDSHLISVTAEPFQRESTTERLVGEVARVLGVTRLRVIERWQGIYASSTQHPYLLAEPQPGITVAIVTTGVGMTISFGLAEKTFARF